MSDPTSDEDLVLMTVDTDACIGGGQCEMLAEDTFLLSDDDAIAAVLGDGRLPHQLAVEVVDRCPGRAISFTTAADVPSAPDENPTR